MRQKPTAGYADRLNSALSSGPNPMSVRALAREMAERYPDLRGTSYGGIRQYAEGKVRNPRMELLRAIAGVLGIRAEWLTFGPEEGGEMTQEAERERREVDLVSGAVAGVVPEGWDATSEVPPGGWSSITHEEGFKHWRRALEVRNGVLKGFRGSERGVHIMPGQYMPPWVAPVMDVCRRLDTDPETAGNALRAPLEALGVRPSDRDHYITSMIPVLLNLAKDSKGTDNPTKED
jgi:transcriptional regulator with XRE-family HTH domain